VRDLTGETYRLPGEGDPARGSMPREVFLGDFRRVALFGGVYSNYLALQAALALARARRVDGMIALGDFGAFGPHPDRSVEILRESGIPCLQGNYEEALSQGADDCRCGYVDPRDNHYARLSFDYTAAKTSAFHKTWMAELPGHLRFTLGGARVLCCHGSPRRVNEFLWASATPDAFLRRLLDEYEADVLVCTHTGLHWSRFLPPARPGAPRRGIVNAGALGRPANDGRTEVWFAILDAGPDGLASPNGLVAEFVPVAYDAARLAREIAGEGLPLEFGRTLLTGWWTTCLEILPAKERAAGRF
jgi:hypothetical protein